MGRLDKRFSNSATAPTSWTLKGEVVFGKTTPRYQKRYNSKGGRRHGQFSIRSKNRSAFRTFSASQSGTTKNQRAD